MDYEQISRDLFSATGTALYFREVRKDPEGAAEILHTARAQSVRDYLSCCGPIYTGGTLDTPQES